MANECSNYITITGEPELIGLIAKDYIGYDANEDTVEFSFEEMLPIPQDILDNNLDYQWRIENWGNKWDGTDCYVDLDDTQIHISVETAWSPCDQWTYKLIELCPGVDIYHEYYEPGEGFIGWISHNGGDEPCDYEEVCYSYSNDNYNYWVTVFEKEYESYDWLCDHIADLVDDEEITEDQHDEVLNMINNDTPLETLISKCVDYDIL